jgi:hypothetical protein
LSAGGLTVCRVKRQQHQGDETPLLDHISPQEMLYADSQAREAT